MGLEFEGRMRKLGAALVLCGAMAGAAWAEPPKTKTPEEWRAAAAMDLVAVHDILRDNSPAMVIDRDSADFRRWLEVGLRQAQADLPKVNDPRGYYYVVQGYVGGFRDSHIQFGPNPGFGVTTRAVAWPGFVLGGTSDGFEVAFRAADAPEGPPLHAKLVACDGKGPEALVQAHDRYDGNFRLPSVRQGRAVGLLLDRADPFVPRSQSCSFQVDGAVRAYTLNWVPLDEAHTKQIDASRATAGGPRKLGLAPWGDNRWWITIPSMGNDQDWNGFYAEVSKHLDAVRAADAVVIDVRGNGGGNSGFGDRLARMLWGETMVDANLPDLGPTVWRASKINRDNWAGVADLVAKDPNYTDQDRQEFRFILARYDAAIAHGEPTFTLGDSGPVKRPAPGPNPMKGRVVMLTDYACNSACLDLMDEITAMPHVVHAGTVTSADTIFMDLTEVPALPSGVSSLAFGRKAWIKRPRGSNVPYTPTARFTWTGAAADEAGLRAWLDKALTAP